MADLPPDDSHSIAAQALDVGDAAKASVAGSDGRQSVEGDVPEKSARPSIGSEDIQRPVVATDSQSREAGGAERQPGLENRAQQQDALATARINWSSVVLTFATVVLAVATVVLAVATVELARATDKLSNVGAKQFDQMQADSKAADERFAIQQKQALSGSATAAAHFREQVTRSDTQFKAQLLTLQASIKAANAQASATRDLATRAQAQVAEAKRLADAASASVRQAATALGVNRSEFNLDERPWVWAKVSEEPYKAGSGKLAVRIDIGNSGKSPAVQTVANISYSENGSPLSRDTFFRTFGSLKKGLARIGVVPPNAGAIGWFNLTPTISSEPSRLDLLAATDQAFAIFGWISYGDRLGNRYRTDFCFNRHATGLWGPCEDHNGEQ